MKSVVVALSIVLGVAAGAADMAIAQIYNPPGADGRPIDWTGTHVGITAGGGWGSSSHGNATGPGNGSFPMSGAVYGGTIGYDWQSGSVIYGVDGDMSGADILGSKRGPIITFCSRFVGSCTTQPQYLVNTRVNDLGTARIRVGYNLGAFMVYATGGLAFGDVHAGGSEIIPMSGVGYGELFRVGWAAGVGIEAALGHQASARIEYLHVDLGHGSVFSEAFSNGTATPQNATFQTDIARLGLVFHLL